MLTELKTMTSVEIAEFAGKLHKNVLQSIRALETAWEKVNGRKFQLVEYTDNKGEKRPMYQLSKTECLYIATKFDDEARAKLILRWEKLENERAGLDFSNPATIVELAQNWANEHAQRIAAEKKVRLLEVKTELMDRVLDADEKIDIGQAAKILELPFGRNTLFVKLREMGVFFKNRNEPQQEYIKKGYFVMKEKYIERTNHEGFVVVKTLVTQRGLAYLATLFRASPGNKKMAVAV